MVGARDYKQNDLKRLFALSGCECANPSCGNKLIAKDYNSILGEICHIEAASPEGPRYNPRQSDAQRRDFDNLILLCESCHKIIDNKANEEEYPVELLKKWKLNHQEKILNSKNGVLPNYFQQIIEAISRNGLMDTNTTNDVIPYDISEKIEYNSLRRNKYIVEDYKFYTTNLGNLYDELEEFGTFKKSVVLNRIRNFYLKVKGTLTDGSIDDIKTISDDIFDAVVDSVCNLVTDSQLDASEIFLAAQIIVVDAFIDCKVLEKPVV